MSLRLAAALVVIWVASLVIVGEVVRGQAHALQPLPSGPTVISGEDVGFRIEGTIGGVPAGTLVIRQNGRWVEPRSKTGLRPVS